MMSARRVLTVALGIAALLQSDASAVRILTNPATEPGEPAIDFVSFSLTPDGSQVVASGVLDFFNLEDRVYTLTLPNDLSTPITPTQISATGIIGDVDGRPIVSPDGSNVLYLDDRLQADPSLNTIYSVPTAGPAPTTYAGLFPEVDNNTVAPGNANFGPSYSPDGNTIFFINAEAGFGGTIPTWTTTSFSANDPSTFGSVWANPDWDVLYSVPAAGGTPTPVTTPADGDIDADLYAVTPNGSTIVYAPDSPIATPRNRGDNRPTLFTVPATGGASTAIPMAPAPNATFTISSMLELTPDGQSVVFIGDYDTPGKNELYSLPLTGGTPTKINDDLHFAGDVRSFAISPDGTSVAYAAGADCRQLERALL